VNPNPTLANFIHGGEYPIFHVIDKKWNAISHGNVVDNFLNSAHYKNDKPDQIFTDNPSSAPNQFTGFETPWSDLDDNYGDEGSAYWVVPADGNYTLWICSDDGSKLYAALDAVPAHRVLIAQEPAWAGYRHYTTSDGGGRGGPPPSTESPTFALTAGQIVYLQVDHVEGGGGDAWNVTYTTDGSQPADGTVSALSPDQLLAKRLSPDGTVFTTLCDVFCSPGPSDQSVYVGGSALFAVVPDGTPPYSYQWKSNGVAIAGATGATYATSAAAEANDGDTYSVTVNNLFSSTSCGAVLHVAHNPIALSALTHNDPNNIYVLFNKPVAINTLDYAVDGGVFVNSAVAGTHPNEVIVQTDGIAADTTHTLTITGLVDTELPPNTIVPNPTTFTIGQGPGRLCVDFNDGLLPAGTIANGTAAPTVGPDFSLHLTANGATGQQNLWTIPLSGVQTFTSFKAKWTTLLNGPIGQLGRWIQLQRGK